MSAVQIPQSASRVVMLKLFLTGTTTAATGKTVVITVSKAGAAFGNPNAGATNATEVSSGWYKVTLDTTDTNTLGDLVVRGTASGCDDTERLLAVVKATTGGLTALPDAAANTNGGLPILSVSGTTLGYTVTTATNLTNAATAGDFTATMKTSIGTAVAASAVASVTGNVGGSVAGSVASVGTGGITSGSFAANALTAAALAADAGTEIAGAVWDLATTGHTTGGTFGAAMNAAGSAGDPLSTLVPGAYAAGTAGYLIGTNLNATVGSRMATFTVPTNFGALGITVAGKISGVALTDTLTTWTGSTPQTGDAYAVVNSGTFGNSIIHTETAAIKAKTDTLPSSPAAVGSQMNLADAAITEAKISTPTETAGRPTGILAMMRRVFEWHSNKRVRTRSTGAVVLQNAADSSALETQAQSTTGGVGSEVDTQTKGV